MPSSIIAACLFSMALAQDTCANTPNSQCVDDGDSVKDEVAMLQTRAVLNKSKLDIDLNQKVYFDFEDGSGFQPVLGAGAGTNRLNVCIAMPDFAVANSNIPKVKVCGTGIKVTLYIMGRCGSTFWDSSGFLGPWTVGSCDKGARPDLCQTLTPTNCTEPSDQKVPCDPPYGYNTREFSTPGEWSTRCTTRVPCSGTVPADGRRGPNIGYAQSYSITQC